MQHGHRTIDDVSKLGIRDVHKQKKHEQEVHEVRRVRNRSGIHQPHDLREKPRKRGQQQDVKEEPVGIGALASLSFVGDSAVAEHQERDDDRGPTEVAEDLHGMPKRPGREVAEGVDADPDGRGRHHEPEEAVERQQVGASKRLPRRWAGSGRLVSTLPELTVSEDRPESRQQPHRTSVADHSTVHRPPVSKSACCRRGE